MMYHLVSLAPKHTGGRRGFSLLEMAVVLAVIAVVIASMLPAVTQTAMQEKQKSLQTKMQMIEQAMLAFRLKHGRLPCPAQGGLAVNAANFGVEAATPGTCTGGTPAATELVADTGTGAVVAGVIPVTTLGLTIDDAFDPWGRGFYYAVDARITSTFAFNTYAADDIIIGNLTIKEREYGTGLTDITTQAIATILSFGASGHGAYMPSGVRYSSGSTNADELENCNCTSAAPPVAGTLNGTFIIAKNSSSSAGGVTSFDDVVRYYTRGSFISKSEIQ